MCVGGRGGGDDAPDYHSEVMTKQERRIQVKMKKNIF